MFKQLIISAVAFLFCTILSAQEPIMTESGTPLEDIYIDGVVKRTLVEEAPVIEYDHVREADVVWERKVWRLIDTREKMNTTFRSPLEPFFSILREISENGDAAIFRDEYFKEPLTVDEIDKKLNRIDTTVVWDPDTYEEKVQVVRNEINWEDIKQFRIKEVWYFDKELSTFKSRILGIGPILQSIDPDTGEFKYQEVLFWMYYPEARYALARYRVQNGNNDIAPMSWYDLFESRFFASYILKISNPLDLRVKDVFYGYDREGIDRLMESEKIKAELFNFEHDLWEY